MTILIRSKSTLPANSLPLAAGISDTDVAINALSGLRAWWRSDIGFSTGAWVDRHGYASVTGSGSQSPVKVLNVQSGEPSLRFPSSGVVGLADAAGKAFIPLAASYSLVYVGRQDPAATINAAMIGNGGNLSTGTWIQHRATDSRVQFYQGGVSQMLSPSGYPPSLAHLGVISYDYGAGTMAMRINAVEVATKTGVSNANADTTLQIGRLGASLALANSSDIFEVMVFSIPLHAAGNAAVLTAVESYLMARYG